MKDKLIKYYEQTLRDIDKQLELCYSEALALEFSSFRADIELKLKSIRSRS